MPIKPGQLQTVPTNKFTVSVSGCKFKILVVLPTGHAYETSYEDQTLLTLISVPTSSNAVFNAIVDSNEIPPDDGTTINYLWLAYASSCYFSRLITNQLSPIWMMDDPNLRDNGFTVQGYWDLSTQPPHLPMQVFYLNDGLYRGLGNDGHAVTFKYHPPFDLGFTNAEYQVQASTNVEGLVFPTRFSFVRYYVNGQNRFVRTLTQAYASKVQAGTTVTNFRPSFSGRSITFDKRFRSAKEPVPSVRYWVTNGNWPPASELSNSYSVSLGKHQAAFKVRASQSKWNSLRRAILLTAFGFLVSAPLLVLLLHVGRRFGKNSERKANKTTKQ